MTSPLYGLSFQFLVDPAERTVHVKAFTRNSEITVLDKIYSLDTTLIIRLELEVLNLFRRLVAQIQSEHKK